MTDIRTRGFDSPAQLREHLAELDEESPAADPGVPIGDPSAEQQIAALRREVQDLRKRLAAIRVETEGLDTGRPRAERHPWLRIGATIAMTYLLGRLAQRLRLGAPGAAAVPVLAAQLDKRIW